MGLLASKLFTPAATSIFKRHTAKQIYRKSFVRALQRYKIWVHTFHPYFPTALILDIYIMLLIICFSTYFFLSSYFIFVPAGMFWTNRSHHCQRSSSKVLGANSSCKVETERVLPHLRTCETVPRPVQYRNSSRPHLRKKELRNWETQFTSLTAIFVDVGDGRPFHTIIMIGWCLICSQFQSSEISTSVRRNKSVIFAYCVKILR